MTKKLDSIIRAWASLGAAFNVRPARGDIDPERLLLDTARHASEMARLFIMAATWLHSYGDIIAKHRLKRLIRDELEPASRPVLGLLLDIAQQGTHPLQFATVIRHLHPAEEAGPLFHQNRRNARMIALAERRASDLSRKWNRWCQPVEFKDDALRPAAWIMARHPEVRTRLDFRGDLRASVLAALRHDPGAGDSEMKLAELAGGSRAQVRNALANLEMTGRVTARPATGANRREVSLQSVA